MSVGADEGNNFFVERTVISLDVLSTNSALEYWTYVPEGIPVEAVSFKTANGITHTYLLGSSGIDGSVAKIQWNIP